MNLKKFKSILLLLMLAIGQTAMAQICDLEVGYADVYQGDNVPEAINSKLQNKVTALLAKEGIIVSNYNSRFFVAGRFDHSYSEVVSTGSAHTYMLKTDLTLIFGDNQTQKVFATVTIGLKGVGDSEERAYIKCLNGLNINNTALKDFVNEGRNGIMQYYDYNYSSILVRAKSAMANRNYDEALYYSTSIPECCRGFTEAQNFTLQCYTNLRDYESAQLLIQAKSAWASNPDSYGAEQASQYLNQIDPSSPSASGAKTLLAEMTKVTQKQWEFENVQKYKDELAMERQRMANETEIRKQSIAANAQIQESRMKAAKEVAVAYAKAQPRVVHHYNWIRW